jgi:hypothetical protein
MGELAELRAQTLMRSSARLDVVRWLRSATAEDIDAALAAGLLDEFVGEATL